MTDHTKALAEALRGFCDACDSGLEEPLVHAHDRALTALAAYDAAPAPSAQCCMCGKTGISTAEDDGGPECELTDGRWVCSADCWDMAVRVFDLGKAPAPSDDFAAGMRRAAEIAWSDDEEQPREWLNWGQHNNMVTAQKVSMEIRDAILAAIPAAGAWEPPADRPWGYKCLVSWGNDDWTTAVWTHVIDPVSRQTLHGSWCDPETNVTFVAPTAFWPLPPAPAGEGNRQ